MKAAQLLLAKGASLDDRNGRGQTPLDRAAGCRSEDMVTLLRERGERCVSKFKCHRRS